MSDNPRSTPALRAAAARGTEARARKMAAARARDKDKVRHARRTILAAAELYGVDPATLLVEEASR